MPPVLGSFIDDSLGPRLLKQLKIGLADPLKEEEGSCIQTLVSEVPEKNGQGEKRGEEVTEL